MASSSSSQASHVFGNTRCILGVTDTIIQKPEMGIPEMYIRSEQESPIIRPDETTPPLPTIPVFDFKSLVSGISRDTELDKLYTACKHWGFFQVKYL